jgi:predicted nuclease of predicted toxin-antitoxin system
MARLLIDESLPVSLVDLLSATGHETVHALAVGLGGAPDDDVFRQALEQGRILVTRDMGFADIRRYPGPTGIVVIRYRGNVVSRQFVESLRARLTEVDLDSLEDKVLILEPNRSRIRGKVESVKSEEDDLGDETSEAD